MTVGAATHRRMTRAEKQQQTRAALLSAASDVFAESGVMAASVEQITARAGFSRGAFYSNFDSKNDLCLALLRRIGDESLAQATAALNAAAERDADVADTVVMVMSQGLLAAHDALLDSELLTYAMRDPEFGRHYARDVEDLHQRLAETILTTTKRLGLTLRMSNTDAVHVLVAVFLHIMHLTALSDGDRSREAQLRSALTAVINAITDPA